MSFYERHEGKISLIGLLAAIAAVIYFIVPHEIAVAALDIIVSGLEGLTYIKG